jgi:hypothetical protein
LYGAFVWARRALNDPKRRFPARAVGNATRHPSPWLGFPWQTLWSKQRIPENSRALFVSVFSPYETAAGKLAAQALASSIHIDVAPNSESATVKLTPHNSAHEVTVKLDIHGKWSSEREAI